MKKVLNVLLMVIATVILASCGAASKQMSDARHKSELKREYAEKLSTLRKEGWQISGSSHSLETALRNHYQKLDSGLQEIVGEVSAGRSLNLMSQAAINNAIVKYASLAGSFVRGRITSDGALDQSTPDAAEEFDRMYEAYERLVQQEIKGEIQPSFSIVRNTRDGLKEFKSFFIIDEDAASKARIRAWERAKEESEVAQKYGEQISEFVQEGFPTEQ